MSADVRRARVAPLTVPGGYIVSRVTSATPCPEVPLGRRPEPRSRRIAHLLTAFTIARLAFIPPVAITFMADPAVTAACLGAFMIADLYDGVLARRFDADGPRRRALDSVVDRIAIDVCLVAAYAAGAMPLVVLVGLLARDLYCSALCAWMFRRRRAAIGADLLYRGLSFLVAVWALAAPFMTQTGRTVAAAALLGLAVAVAIDLTRGVRQVIASPQDLAGRVIPAGALRARRAWRTRRVPARAT